MTLHDAILYVESTWGLGTAKYLGCGNAYILRDADSIQEYEWGWVFCFVGEGETTRPSKTKCLVAFHKVTKKTTAVGPKGLEFALADISK